MDFRAHPFTLRQLQYAVAVAGELSFRKAAARCHVSQPSLSAQLAQLEESLGTRLFERDRRRVLLTASGREVIARARAVLRESDDVWAVAQQLGDPLASTLRIGVIPTVSPYLLPVLRPALRSAHPSLALRWVEDRTEPLMVMLDAGNLDAALVALEADVGDVAREAIGDDPFVLVTPKRHPLGRATTPVDRSALREQDVLLLDEAHCFRDQALAVCARAKAHELEFRATSVSTLAQMVADGAGITLLPRMAVSTETKRAALSVRPFAPPAPKRTIGLVWRKRSPIGDALRRLAATARAAYPSG